MAKCKFCNDKNKVKGTKYLYIMGDSNYTYGRFHICLDCLREFILEGKQPEI